MVLDTITRWFTEPFKPKKDIEKGTSTAPSKDISIPKPSSPTVPARATPGDVKEVIKTAETQGSLAGSLPQKQPTKEDIEKVEQVMAPPERSPKATSEDVKRSVAGASFRGSLAGSGESISSEIAIMPEEAKGYEKKGYVIQEHAIADTKGSTRVTTATDPRKLPIYERVALKTGLPVSYVKGVQKTIFSSNLQERLGIEASTMLSYEDPFGMGTVATAVGGKLTGKSDKYIAESILESRVRKMALQGRKEEKQAFVEGALEGGSLMGITLAGAYAPTMGGTAGKVATGATRGTQAYSLGTAVLDPTPQNIGYAALAVGPELAVRGMGAVSRRISKPVIQISADDVMVSKIGDLPEGSIYQYKADMQGITLKRGILGKAKTTGKVTGKVAGKVVTKGKYTTIDSDIDMTGVIGKKPLKFTGKQVDVLKKQKIPDLGLDELSYKGGSRGAGKLEIGKVGKNIITQSDYTLDATKMLEIKTPMKEQITLFKGRDTGAGKVGVEAVLTKESDIIKTDWLYSRAGTGRTGIMSPDMDVKWQKPATIKQKGVTSVIDIAGTGKKQLSVRIGVDAGKGPEVLQKTVSLTEGRVPSGGGNILDDTLSFGGLAKTAKPKITAKVTPKAEAKIVSKAVAKDVASTTSRIFRQELSKPTIDIKMPSLGAVSAGLSKIRVEQDKALKAESQARERAIAGAKNAVSEILGGLDTKTKPVLEKADKSLQQAIGGGIGSIGGVYESIGQAYKQKSDIWSLSTPKMGFSTGVRSRAKTSPIARTKAESVVRSMPKLRSGIFEETITGIIPKTATAQRTVQRAKQKSMSAAMLGGFPNFPDVLPRFSVPAVPAFGAGGSIFDDTMMKPGRRVKPGKAEYKPSLGGLLFDVRKKKIPKRLTGFEPIRPMKL